jgi:hypothetical protein
MSQKKGSENSPELREKRKHGSKPLVFITDAGKKIRVVQGKGHVTPYGGTMALAQTVRTLKIRERLDQLVPGAGSNRGYSPSEVIIPVVAMLHCGGSTLSDLERVVDDEVMKELFGFRRIPDATTVGDWLVRRGGEESEEAKSESLTGIEKSMVSVAADGLKKEKVAEVLLDIDATMIACEKAESRMTYKGFPGMSSLMAFDAKTGYCIAEMFRNGNISPQAGNLEILRKSEENLKAHGIRIGTVRSDSAGYQAAIINHCRRSKIHFVIAGDLDKAVKTGILSIPEALWKPFLDKEGRVVEDKQVSSFIHSMEETEESFRMVVERKPKKEKADAPSLFPEWDYRVIATDIDGDEMEIIRLYNQRGRCENYIREAKYGFSLKHLPCGTVSGNATWVKIGMLAYNIGIYFKRSVLPEDFQRNFIQRIRYMMYNISAKIVNHAGETFLKMFCPDALFQRMERILEGCVQTC